MDEETDPKNICVLIGSQSAGLKNKLTLQRDYYFLRFGIITDYNYYFNLPLRLQRGLDPRSRIEGLDDPRVTLDSRGLLVEGRGFKNVHYLATIFKTSILLVSENYTFRTSRHQTLTLI